jgi:cytoskeletal protein RodZ
VQSPSSLIFLVLLGVWAAYFVQYWIRRRDHLATARSVEQFSAAMRVLERRATIPRTDLSDPAPRSWSVHPARSARPQVVVKRAVPAEVGSPRTVSAPVERPAAWPAPAARSGAPRRARGLLLLTSLVGLVVTGVLAALSVLVVWAPVVALGAVVLAFAWVRAGVKADRSAAAARRRRSREEARRRASAPAASSVRRPVSRPAAAAPAARTGTETLVEEPAVAEESVVAAEATVAEPATDEPAELVEMVEVVAETAPVAPLAPEPEPVIEYVHLVDEDDIPLTWDPVPVPRPTYTMKAKAERPEVAPAAVTPDPVPVENLRSREDDLDERRVAGA